MHAFISNTPEQQKQMLDTIGANRVEDLFDSIPRDVRLGRKLNIPDAMSEMKISQDMKALAKTNANVEDYTCFLGAGAYDHFIPSVIDHLLLRQEFYTAYTPYQPEISQGTLQAIYEYQSMICMLTGMDVANASMYDGASALGEAALMACQATRRNEVLVAAGVHPQSREVLKTYARFQDIKVSEYLSTDGMADLDDLESKLTENTAAVIVQTPNFFGIIEELQEVEKLVHKNNALLIVCCDPISLAVLKPPGEMGADIVVGEGQAMGNTLSFGGPYLGFFATKEKLLRKMPGRIVGETADTKDRRGFVLTIQTREQHIRREKATSNICTNQALNALAATIYLSAMGKQGLQQAATQCIHKARYAYNALIETGLFEPVFDASFFKEFAIFYKGDIKKLNQNLLRYHIIGGYDLGCSYPEHSNTWLVAVTEKRTKQEIDMLIEKVVAS